MKNLLAGQRGVLREEGRISHQHFKQDNTQRPPINSLSIPVLSKDFRSNIIGGTHSGVSQLSVSSVLGLLGQITGVKFGIDIDIGNGVFLSTETESLGLDFSMLAETEI